MFNTNFNKKSAWRKERPGSRVLKAGQDYNLSPYGSQDAIDRASFEIDSF
jgi:hypothetical protein